MTLDDYHILFIVFLVLTMLLVFLLVILFFVFDIRKIISIKTGWAEKKSIRELNEINSGKTEKQRKKYKGHSMSLKDNTGEIQGNRVPDRQDSDEEVLMATVTLKLDQDFFVIFKSKEIVFANEVIPKEKKEK